MQVATSIFSVTDKQLVIAVSQALQGDGWVCLYSFSYMFICRSSRMTALRFAIILLHHAPPKGASVLVLFVIFGGSCQCIGLQVGLIGFLLPLWWPVLLLFILLGCIEGKVNESEVIDYTLGLSFHSFSDLFSVTELTFLDS